MTNASISTIILEYVCPSLGMIAANIMFAAPLKDCYRAVLQGRLDTLNPTPWAFMLGNTFGWVTYGILKDRNLFIFFANAPGFVMSIWLNLQATKLQYAETRNSELRNELDSFLKRVDPERNADSIMVNEVPSTTTAVTTVQSSKAKPKPSAPQENYVLFMVVIWLMLVSIICFADISQGMKLKIIGTADNINLVFFYGAPLSTIYTVLKSKSAATIHVPTMLTNTANGSFWAAYGVAVIDPFIAVPNALGALLGIIQIVLCFIFPRNNKTESATTTTTLEDKGSEPHCHSTAELVEEDTSISLNIPIEK